MGIDIEQIRVMTYALSEKFDEQQKGYDSIAATKMKIPNLNFADNSNLDVNCWFCNCRESLIQEDVIPTGDPAKKQIGNGILNFSTCVLQDRVSHNVFN